MRILLHKVGKIIHYYDRIGVAVVKLTDDELHTGDLIHIGDADDGFNQTVGSMECDHQTIFEAQVGDEIGLKVDRKVQENTEVYLE